MNRTLQLALGVALTLGLLSADGRTNAGDKKAPAKKDTAPEVIKVVVTADKPDADGSQTATISLTPEKPWYVLANPVGTKDKDLATGATVVTIGGKGKPQVVKIDYPAGTLIKDKDIGDYRVYTGKVEIKAHIRRAKGDAEKLEVSVWFVPHNVDFCLTPIIANAVEPEPGAGPAFKVTYKHKATPPSDQRK
jgi:hypothetical protein